MSTFVPHASPLHEPIERAGGFTEVVKLDNPGAGNDAPYVIGRRWFTRPVAITFDVTTSAVAGARQPYVSFLDDVGSLIAAITAPFAQGPNTSALYSLAEGMQPGGSVASGIVTLPLPALFLLPTWSIDVNVGNFAAADSIAGVVLVLGRFSTDPEDYRPGARARRRGA